MDLLDRFGWLLLGMAVGFVLGYIVASLREIKEEVDEIDDIVKGRRNEKGFMRFPLVADLMLILVLAIVVAGALSAQNASNKTDRNQEEIAQITACNQEFLADTIEALNQRTTYTQEQAALNVELQKAQSQFLAILLGNPPPSDERVKVSLRTYFDSLSRFVAVNEKTQLKVKRNPYPTTQDFKSCLEENDNE